METVGYTRVVVVAPRTRVDVALPSDLAVVELMPQLLDMVGERSDDGGAHHDGWLLHRSDGGVVDASRSLRAHDVLDGTLLTLSTARPVDPEPVFDDVVDAIAAAVRDRRTGGDLREVAGAVLTATALAAATAALLLSGPGILAAGVAALAAVVVVASAAAVARTVPAPVLGVATAGGGVVLAATAGALAVPGPLSAQSALLAGTAALFTAVVSLVMLGTGTLTLSALAVAGGFLAVGGLSGTLWDAPASHHAVVAGTLAVAALTVVPWVSVRLAQLPMPVIPTSPDELRDTELGPDTATVGRRAAVAAEYLDGMGLGCALVAAGGAALALATGPVFGLLYGAAVVAVLLLRMRSLTGRRQRLAMLLTAAAAGLVGAVLLARGRGSAALVVAVVALALAALAVVGAVSGRRRRTNPMTGRFLDLTEAVLLAALLPLAVGVLDLYSVVRHL